jgi:hypothetical protein
VLVARGAPVSGKKKKHIDTTIPERVSAAARSQRGRLRASKGVEGVKMWWQSFAPDRNLAIMIVTHHYHKKPEQDGVYTAELHHHCRQARQLQHEQKGGRDMQTRSVNLFITDLV